MKPLLKFLSNCFWLVAYIVSAITCGIGLVYPFAQCMSGPPVGIGFIVIPLIVFAFGAAIGSRFVGWFAEDSALARYSRS